ncbi:unnamed protein product [Polarella glacialis]|uniref:Sugar phosphate transporter domain-containing protein n=1 Tax=Polarella glacialis TaxID=89957 RepID=A0A813FJW1_POLGL|nr:unnamed protein product [Polarella glacialis]
MLFPKSYMDKEGETGTSIGGRVKPLIARDFMVIAVFAFGGYAVSFLNQKFVACPHLAQIRRASPPPPHVGALLAAALYGANIAYNVMNKRLLLAHPCPLSVTTMNFGTASMCCMLAWGLGVQKPAKLTRELCARLVPLVLLHWAGILAANVAVCEVNIAFTHTVKSAEPFFTAAFSMAFLGAVPSKQAWFSLVLVVAGVAIAATTEASFTFLGLFAAMASNVGVSLRTVLSKRLIDSKDKGLDPVNFIAVLHCGSFFVSLPATLLLERNGLATMCQAHDAGIIMLIGVLVWVFNIASILILSRTSCVTHSLIRTLRRPMLVVGSILAFGTTVRPLNVVGIAVALLGAYVYTGSLETTPQGSRENSPPRRNVAEVQNALEFARCNSF